MYRLSFVDAGGDTVAEFDTEFETEYGAVFAGVKAVKRGNPHSLYVEDEGTRSKRYAHFIPNSKIRNCLDTFGEDVRAASNALCGKGDMR